MARSRAKKNRAERVTSPPPTRRASKSIVIWEQPLASTSGQSTSSHSQEGKVDQYAEFVNMPVGILVGFLVPFALCADWRMMTKDQRIMLLVLFLGTMVAAFLTFIYSESFIHATASSRSASSSSTIEAHRHSRTLHLFMYLSFMFMMFLICLQSPALRKSMLPKFIFLTAIAGNFFARFTPTARRFDAWINSGPPNLQILRHAAIFLVLLGFSLSLKKGSMHEVKVAVTNSYEKVGEGLQKLKPSELRKIIKR